MKKMLSITIALGVLVFFVLVSGDTFTDEAAFQSALGAVTVIDFEGFATGY